MTCALLLAAIVGFSPSQTEFKNGIVVTTTSPLSAKAGVEILKDGGTAADAAAAVALAQIVESGGSYVSAAGIFGMVYFDAASGRLYSLHAGFDTPREERDPMSIPEGKPTGRSALVPGFMAGVDATISRFGKKSRAEVFAPAIKMAKDGIEVNALLGTFISARKEFLSRRPETKRIFFKQDGTPYKTGDTLAQPELAETYGKVAEQGIDYIYRGPWAKAFVEAVGKEEGKITLEDMKAYRTAWQEPIRAKYRGFDFALAGYGSLGGYTFAEALNLLELADLPKSGSIQTSAESIAKLMRIAQCQAISYLPRSSVQSFRGQSLLPESRVRKETSQWVWDTVKMGGFPWFSAGEAAVRPSPHSDGIVVVDRWGNVAAVTHTINAVTWGDTGLFVGGISIPDSGAHQKFFLVSTGPGKRLPDPMCPMIVLKDGKPWLGSSTIGGGLHQKTLQVMVNLIDFKMELSKAANAPGFVFPDYAPGKATDYMVAGEFSEEMVKAVEAQGQTVKTITPAEASGRRGYWIGAMIQGPSRTLSGAGTTILPVQTAGY